MKFTSLLSFARISLAGLVLVLVAPVHAAGKPAPQVSVSLRGVAGQTLEQGESWRVVVRLDLPRGSQNALVLAPEAGTWADALAVELCPASGTTVAARAEPMGKPDAATATLDAQHVAGGLWRFSAEAMQAVGPGAYRLRVQLKIDSGRGWKGVAAAREVPLTVVVPATMPSVQRIVNRAQDLLLTDKVQEAAALVDGALKNAPRDYALLKVRALIAEKADNPFAAIMCLNAANFSTVKKTAGQPPAEDGEMLARWEVSRKTASAHPPAWTWPPAEVLTALSLEAQKSFLVPSFPAERPPGARNDTPPTIPANPPGPTPVPKPAPPASMAAPAPPAPAELSFGVIVPAAGLTDAKITADPTGQWAVGATAGTQYGRTPYAAVQATGAPNIAVAGNSPDAWCPASKTSGTDWLEVTFVKPAHATEVRVRQNDAVGAIAKIEAIEPGGTTHVWWEGVDPYVAPATRDIVWFAVRVPKTNYLVAKVKITLNLAAGPGWKEIDAVQLIGSEQ